MPIDMALSLLIAFLAGTIAAITGAGGGVFIVPAMSLIFDLPLHQAIGTSLAMVTFTSISSAISYCRQRRIDYKVGSISITMTVPGAFAGGRLTAFITPRLLGLIFGFSLILIASHMMLRSNNREHEASGTRRGWHRKLIDSDGTVFEYNANVWLGLPLGFFAGLSSGLLGIGGGSVMVPVMHLVMGLPMHVTVATSMFIMIFTSVSGVATHISLGNLQLNNIVLLCIGVIFGGQIGAYISKRVSGRSLRRIFGVVLLLVSIRMILKYI